MPPKKPQPLSTYDQGLLRSYLDNRDMLSLDDQAEARAILESRRLDVPSAGELARTIQAPASTIRPATTRERIHDAFADPVNAFRGFRDRTMANLPPEVQALTPDMTVAEYADATREDEAPVAPSMRPVTGAERLRGNMRDVLGSIKKQPLAQMAAPFLGLDVDAPSHAPEGSDPILKIGMIPDIGGKFTTGGRKLVGGLYSRLDEALDLIPKKGVHPNKARKILRDNSSAEERAYRGVDDFLETQGDRVTPEALAAHLEANPAPFPQTKTIQDTPNFTAADQSQLDELERLDYNRTPEQDDLFQSLIDRENASHSGAGTPELPKYSNYQVPGGEHYRETLQTLPDAKAARLAEINDEIWSLSHSMERTFDANPPVPGSGPLGDDVVSTISAGRKRLAALRAERSSLDAPAQFTSPHFDDPNILVSTRSGEHALPTGERGRVIENVQSDWHQTGREKGYEAGPMPPRSYDVTDRIIDAIDGKPPPGVPDGPFKESWPNLGIEREIVDAAESGAEWIAITPSEVLRKRGETISPQFQDQRLPNILEKLLAPFGGGSQEIAEIIKGVFAPIVRLTPEMRERILKEGIPLMALMAAIHEAGGEESPQPQGTIGNVLAQ